MPVDLTRLAFLFPGQGSQKVGMGRELAQADRHAAAVFAEADEILGSPLSKICWEGPAESLNDTAVTQPALLTHSVAVLRALAAHIPGFRPAAVAGHSLGEFSALVAAGALDFPRALRLVRERGRLMKEAGARNPGGMAAILGLDAGPVDEVCRRVESETGRVVQVANDNCPGQIVISGHDDALALAMERLSAAGAKRAIRLSVSIAAHSALMAPIAPAFAASVQAAGIGEPALPIIGNVSAARLSTADAIRAEVEAQLTARVRWTETIGRLIADGVTAFAEIGAGEVLIGLVRRIDRSPSLFAFDLPDSYAALLG